MIVTTKKLFEHAYGKYAIGAYNVNNAEQIVGLFRDKRRRTRPRRSCCRASAPAPSGKAPSPHRRPRGPPSPAG